jgi:hypothetical protein
MMIFKTKNVVAQTLLLAIIAFSQVSYANENSVSYANENSSTFIGWVDRVSEDDFSILVGDVWVYFKPQAKIFLIGREDGLGLPFSSLKSGQWLLVESTWDMAASKYLMDQVSIFESEAQAINYAIKFDIQR